MIVKKFILFVAIVAGCTSVFGQKTLWTTGNARTLAAGQQEFGIIQPFQIGITDKLEMSVSPLAGLSLVPNISFKYRWTDGPWMIATQHTYLMPTMLLHSMQDSLFTKLIRRDTLTFSDTLRIPYVFTFRNQVLVTRKIGKETLITGKAGFEFSLKTKADSIPALTYPQFYLQSTTLNKKLLWFTGVRVDGNLYKDYNYMAELDFVSSGFGAEHWAIEHKGYFIWNKTIKFAALIGYKMSYGTYPFPASNPVTNQGRFFIFPVADLIWKLNIKRQPEKDLFRVR
ncbi:MAG: hypothetical protein D4R64_17900 [Porphyromonadaceae bacterium]|nr:MAG: hypothetical protein D4R64_17900 [Porphyromonadaceae bacterium]